MTRLHNRSRELKRYFHLSIALCGRCEFADWIMFSGYTVDRCSTDNRSTRMKRICAQFCAHHRAPPVATRRRIRLVSPSSRGTWYHFVASGHIPSNLLILRATNLCKQGVGSQKRASSCRRQSSVPTNGPDFEHNSRKSTIHQDRRHRLRVCA
jgi:hypothetical protein